MCLRDFLIKLQAAGSIQWSTDDSPAQLFPCDFWEFFNNNYFVEHLHTTASLTNSICNLRRPEKVFQQNQTRCRMLPSRHLLAQSQQTINRTIFRTISCVPNICLHFISDEVAKMLIFDMSHGVYKKNFCMKYFFNKRGLVPRKLQVCSELLRNLNWKTSFF